jgi:hypothetical protein
MLKLNTAADDVPTFVIVAEDPADPVVTVPTAMVAASPGTPCTPCGPVSPTGPCGMPKSKTAADDVPTLATVADAPGDRVVVVPTAIVAAEPVSPLIPCGPCGPVGPVAPVAPVGPCGPVAPGVPSSMDRLAGAVPRTERASVLSDPSTVTVSEPRTSVSTVMEDIG